VDQDFEFGGKKFRLSKISAFKQFHIVRRIAPILADLAPQMTSAQSLKDVGALNEDEKLETIAKFVSPIMTGLSKLNDADADHVLKGLLESVEVKQETGNWAKIVRGDLFMMQDLELPALLQLAGRAFMFNLSGFFGALPQS